jgi:hypothetical protein
MHDALARLDEAEPLARKILVAPTVNFGRDVLVALTRRRGVLVGWEATTLRRLADRLAWRTRMRANTPVWPDVVIGAQIGAALDAVIADGRAPEFAALAGSAGFRQAVRDAVLELRMGGIAAAALRAASARPATRALAAVLERYEVALTAERALDPAGLFRLALDAFAGEAPHLLGAAHVVLVGVDDVAGLPAALRRRLLERPTTRELVHVDGDAAAGIAADASRVPMHAVGDAAEALAADASRGPGAAEPLTAHGPRIILPPRVARPRVVRAVTPDDEVRHVIGRAIADGVALDELELATDQRDVYGPALQAVCERAALPWTSLHGLPLLRTRFGRALHGALALLEFGISTASLVTMLRTAELTAPADDGATGDAADDREPDLSRDAEIAMLLAELRVGGPDARARDLAAALRRRPSELEPRIPRDADDVERAAILDAFHRRAQPAAVLLEQVVALRARVRGERLGLPVLAQVLRDWLTLIPALADEGSTRARITRRLEALAAGAAAPLPREVAFAEARTLLESLRTWPSGLAAPWSARGGAVHLTDLRHAGATGRRRVVLLGLDADSVRGRVQETPFLDDAARAQLRDAADQPLADAAARMLRRRRRLDAAVQRAGDDVVLAWSAGTAHDVAPDRLLLELLRQDADAGATTEELVLLAEPAEAIPAPGTALDAHEARLAALFADGVPRRGEAAALAAHPALARWAANEQAWRDPEALTSVHGLSPALASHEPRAARRAVSPSELETLARCPRRWVYATVLGLRPADEPDDAAPWLDAPTRGSLLHDALDEAARLAGLDADPHSAAFEEALDEAARRALARLVQERPPAHAGEVEAAARLLAADLRVFAAMERARATEGIWQWSRHEAWLESPAGGGLVVDGGAPLALRGRIDRLDRAADGSLAVWDYKSGRGSTLRDPTAADPLDGGRLLQPFLYAELARQATAARVTL